MLPATANSRLSLFALFLLIFDFCCAYPSPYSYTSTVFPRQETQATLPATVTHTERIVTGVGTFIQTCTIVFTPTVVNGMDMVREEKSCVVTPDNGNDASSALPPPASSSTVSTELPSTTLTSSPTSTSTTDTLSSTSTDVPPSPGISSSTVLPDPTATDLPPASSSPPPPPGVPAAVVGTSSVSNPVATPQPESTGPTTVSLPPPSSSRLPLSSTPTAEGAGAPTTSDPPGKKLEVLPIGLGVFAGISVVALAVVGIVTYERTKHRRNFRKLKLEQAGNRMGYGAA